MARPTSPSLLVASGALTSVEGVQLLHWPASHHVRAGLDAACVPRILLVGADAPPPDHWDDLEDWVRLPLDVDEVLHRARTLRRRARALERPWFDDDGLLRVGERWIDVPGRPRAALELLVRRFGRVVPSTELWDVYLEAGGSARQSARKTMIVRLRERLAEAGLLLHNVRDAGYVLDWDDGRDVTQPSATRAISCSSCSDASAADET